ncbi:Cell cycle checkpoint protein rad17 [Scheffersomyces spartinae]|uniref:Cell cycle checkpoint protein rad17 n=1 Tax=Scheffersomyces spartinae TaxID=45513 RepID=A0A9P8AIH9_9ASCO|nr:Cell cycle checkpoint protein rad17 [Scheffersomyces spartinae]KAG7193694.1 Cell cycle checkpoint protein rad17 [Scheffersomyces spartinae]
MKRKRNVVKDANTSDVSDDLSDEVIEDVASRPKVRQLEPILDQWIDKYSPQSVPQVCMNPQKLKQIQQALNRLVNGEKRLLILSGPAGSSKSTAVLQLAGQVLEGSASESVISYEEVSGAEGEFDDWLQGIRYRIGNSLRVVLVEELPNVFHKGTLNRFRSAILQWVCDTRPVPPLVLSLTEVDDIDGGGLTIDSLLPRWILSHHAVEWIKVNKIAAKFIRKSVGEVVAKESIRGGGLWGIGRENINTFIDSIIDLGDIRAIIANLQTWSRLGKQVVTDEMFRRENGLELFHSLGKIMYGSIKDESDEITLQHVLTLYNDLLLLESTVFENYQMYNNGTFPIEAAQGILRLLGDGDIIRMPEASISSVRHSFSRIPRDGSIRRDRIRFPRQYKVMSRARQSAIQISDYRRFIGNIRVSSCDVNLVDGFFVPQIYNSFRYKYLTGKRSKYRYRRIGGDIRLSGDEDTRPLMFGDGETQEEDGDQMDHFTWEIIQKKLKENEDSDDNEGELSDPIEDSDSTMEAKLTGTLEAMLTDDSDDDSDINQTMKEHNDNDKKLDDTYDSLLSDSDLDLLMSQGIIRQTYTEKVI